MKATLTAYYNRDPRQLAVDKPAGEWKAFDAFLKSLGFRRARANWQTVPGRLEFMTSNSDELERVIGIVRAGGEYLTGGNLDFTFQV